MSLRTGPRLVSMLLAFLVLFGCPTSEAREHAATAALDLQAPAGKRPVSIDPSGETILPNGRLITPYGRHVKVAPHPYGLALNPDGRTLVTVNSGTSPFSATVISGLNGSEFRLDRIPAVPAREDSDLESVWMGAALSPDGRTVYISEGENGRIGAFDLASHARLATFSLDGTFQGRAYHNSLTGDLKLSPDGRYLYVLDLAHFQLVILDAQAKQIVSRIRVGRMPFALSLSPDGSRAYVSNVGMFEYELVQGFDPDDVRDTGLDFPPFGFPSKEAEEGATIGGKRIRGLGSPNVPESNSVWAIDVSQPATPRVLAKVPTGKPVGEASVGGSSPGAVIADSHRIYISNGAQDSITILNARSLQIERTVLLEPAASVRGLRGVLPFGMALSPDRRRLYVACAGINALAVLDPRKGRVLGYIPTAWFPARVAVSPDGKFLYVASAKGFGAGPNGGASFKPGPEGTYIGDITHGVVSTFSAPKERELPALTARVVANNGFSLLAPPSRDRESPLPPPGESRSKIRHVVFVVKENRTFDELLGDLAGAGSEVDGDSSLARWGEKAVVKEKGSTTIEDARVTPNHHALARRFAFNDNFYVDADVSTDGHHWLVGNYPNELVEATWPAEYGKKFHFRADPEAPGRVGIGASNPWPESFLEAGSLWEHLARHGITFRNYGEGMDMAGQNEGPGLLPTGIRNATNMPMPAALFENTSRNYATYNTNISDQYRFEQFRREFTSRYANGKEPLPQFLYIWLPNDHTAAPRPEDGYPYRGSFVADNDLALGRLVELLSHSEYWKDMAIFVTEDDAQDGLDHVDAHRSLLLVISPYARRGVSHVHTSMASILKTFDLIFGLPALNQYDAAATDLRDMFVSSPDFTPFEALPSDPRIFDPGKVREPGLDLGASSPRPSEPLDNPTQIRRRMIERLRDHR